MTADRLSRSALYGALLVSPLALGASRPWPLAILELLMLAGLLCASLRMIKEGRLEWRRSAIDLPLLLLIVLIFVQLAVSKGALAAWALRQRLAGS